MKKDYEKVQNFGENGHLGEDWNGKGGGNTHLGDAHEEYLAHLHLELREEIGLPTGGRYSYNQEGYLNLRNFIEQKKAD